MLYTDFVTRMASLHYSPRKVSGPRAVSTQRCDRECFFSNFLSWKFCVFTRLFTFICNAGTLLAIYTSHGKDETSSFLYPAEFLSGVTSYEKSQSALHR